VILRPRTASEQGFASGILGKYSRESRVTALDCSRLWIGAA
jgi:hypothetical protein